MKIKRICEQCGKEFETKLSEVKRGNGKFCSYNCANESHKKRVKRICENCGKEFEVTPSAIKRGKGKFCSYNCSFESQKTQIKQICKQCGKEFKIIPSQIERGRGKFCSRKCFNTAKIKKVERICLQCDKTFKVKRSNAKKGYGVFCSKKCYGKWQSQYRAGENNQNWKGGLSFEPYCFKFNREFKEYIRNKFGRICFLCKKTEEENGRRLSVHHVNYNKNCGCDDDNTCQFVPLCTGCNNKVNSNRNMWETKIKAKMRNKLNGWFI